MLYSVVRLQTLNVLWPTRGSRAIPRGQNSFILTARAANHGAAFASSCPPYDNICLMNDGQSFVSNQIFRPTLCWTQQYWNIVIQQMLANNCNVGTFNWVFIYYWERFSFLISRGPVEIGGGGKWELAKILIAATKIKSLFVKLLALRAVSFVFPRFLDEVHFIDILVILEIRRLAKISRIRSAVHIFAKSSERLEDEWDKTKF